jgi:hypothetical protein
VNSSVSLLELGTNRQFFPVITYCSTRLFESGKKVSMILIFVSLFLCFLNSLELFISFTILHFPIIFPDKFTWNQQKGVVVSHSLSHKLQSFGVSILFPFSKKKDRPFSFSSFSD